MGVHVFVVWFLVDVMMNFVIYDGVIVSETVRLRY